MMVINTVLSVMAYDYPQEKLSVYLSDDAGSDLTFYALLEASHFSKHWIPYCKKFRIEPRSPAVYFSSTSLLHGADQDKDFELIQVQSSNCWRDSFCPHSGMTSGVMSDVRPSCKHLHELSQLIYNQA